jgi:hypothetical protein
MDNIEIAFGTWKTVFVAGRLGNSGKIAKSRSRLTSIDELKIGMGASKVAI